MKLAIAGPQGRMGKAVREAIDATPQVEWVEGLFEHADGVIDFTAPDYSLELSAQAASAGKLHIIGTTGFTDAQTQALTQTASCTRTVWAYNMSVGVNVVAALVERAAQVLNDEFDIEVLEMHHRLKKDSPSGTALMLADAAAKGRGTTLKDAERYYTKSMLGERERGTIGIAARRGGAVIGDHTVSFAGLHEVIDITHRALDRSIYANGAIAAALWLKDKPAGLYTMRDVVGI